MKVKELFDTEKVNIDFISVHFAGSYWEKADRFVKENWESEINDMSDKQKKWLKSLFDDVVEFKIEKM